MAVGTRMQQRRALAAEWSASGYVLAAGELGVTTDTGIIKIGDGVNAWSALDPAFDSQYLPLLGQAADSALLGGISAASFVKVADTSVTATNNTYVKRTADGGVKGTDATEATELTSLQQMQAAIGDSQKMLSSRTITSAATLALTDIGKTIYVGNTSLTTNIVVTIPLNSSVAIPVGSQFYIATYDVGGAKITPAGGVGLNGATIVMPKYGCVRLVKTGTDNWDSFSVATGKRLPKIKVRRTSGTENYGSAYVFVAYDTVDTTTDSYNPDSEWFSIPGTGLSTARRIIVNKDGEYLFNVNFASQGTAEITYCRLAKMTADNSTASMQIVSVGVTQAICSLSILKRVTAGESFGVHHGFATSSVGKADAEASGGDPNNFMITRISD